MSAPSAVFSELTRHGFVRSLTWEEVRPGDRISFVYYGRWGFERAYRNVVVVNWPTITLDDSGRHYSINCVEERESKGASHGLRLERQRAARSQESPS
jgi:hypothetical protein